MGLGTAVGAPRNVAKVLSMFVSTAAASWTNHVPNGLSKMQPLERLMGYKLESKDHLGILDLG